MSDFNTTISFDVFSVSLSFVDEGTFVVVKQYVDEQLDSKQDTLIAGDNITISGNVISADLNDYLTIVDATDTYETIENVNSLSDIVSGHTRDIEYLQTNKSDKATAYTKSEVEQIKLDLLNLIYAGL